MKLIACGKVLSNAVYTFMTNEQLLLEVEDLLRTMPALGELKQPTSENLNWLGRLSAVIGQCSDMKGLQLGFYLDALQGRDAWASVKAAKQIVVLLHAAQHDLRMQTLGPVSIAVPNGSVFEYFDQIRKTLEGARQDVLFIDPYLDAEFVSRYLVHIASGVTIRLLGRAKLPTLLPAVDAFVQQHEQTVQVRSWPQFHDRYVFIDGTDCYQSGASFKDGAKSAPTTLTQITDAFPAVLKTYEDIWIQAKVERK